MNLDDLLTALHAARQETAALSRQHDEAKARKTDLEHEVENMMGDIGVLTAGNEYIKISLTEEIVPNVLDWEELFHYIEKNKAFYLLQKRMAAGAYRESEQQGLKIPGVEPFTKTKMSVRAT